jgi:hypothetical protein
MVSAGYEAESDMICKVVFVSLINADPQHCLYYVITVNIYVAITHNTVYHMGGSQIRGFFASFSGTGIPYFLEMYSKTSILKKEIKVNQKPDLLYDDTS